MLISWWVSCYYCYSLLRPSAAQCNNAQKKQKLGLNKTYMNTQYTDSVLCAIIRRQCDRKYPLLDRKNWMALGSMHCFVPRGLDVRKKGCSATLRWAMKTCNFTFHYDSNIFGGFFVLLCQSKPEWILYREFERMKNRNYIHCVSKNVSTYLLPCVCQI